ncbi:hypothetical protein [Paraburkholderia sp. J41]|uniref:hypothetical protein n=1 Tax=Paraburkholderia sp. J41 TaxID=2805433 RepID=UPI002AC35D4F|nr:hypothetical protein [Paraburkholderia sp. J41]
MLKRLLAVAALGSLAGCVVGPGPGNGYYSQGYYDQGYAQSGSQPGYYDQGYAGQPAYPVYGAAPVYAPAYGVVDIGVVGGHRDSRDRPPRPDGRWQHDDGHGRPAPQGGYGGGPRPQAGQPQGPAPGRAPGQQQTANGGSVPSWRASNGGGWNGNARAQQDNRGGRGNGAGGSNRQGDWH